MNATEHSVADLILSGEQKRSAKTRKQIIVNQLVDCLFALIVLISITVFCEVFHKCCSDINLQYTVAGSAKSALYFEFEQSALFSEFDSSKEFIQRPSLPLISLASPEEDLRRSEGYLDWDKSALPLINLASSEEDLRRSEGYLDWDKSALPLINLASSEEDLRRSEGYLGWDKANSTHDSKTLEILDCQKFAYIVQNSDINPTTESMNTRQQTLKNIEVVGEPSMGGVDSRANAGGGERFLSQQDLSAIASLINIGVKQQQIANKDVEDATQGRHPLNSN
jgi:hypothetical protein